MPYSVQADVETAAGGTDRLKELSDLNGTGAVNAAVVTAAIAEADAWIDMYVQRRYAVPLVAPPEAIKRMSAAEAVYRLKRNRRSTTDRDEQEHDERLELLRDISRGMASVGVDPSPVKSTNVVPEVIQRSEDEAISRKSLEDW